MTSVFVPLDWNGKKKEEEEEKEPVGFCCHQRQPHTEKSFRQNEIGSWSEILVDFGSILLM